MLFRERLMLWVREALGALGGSGTINDVAKHLWDNHEAELRDAGEHFYSWQTDLRWAAQQLRNKRLIGLSKIGSKSLWVLK